MQLTAAVEVDCVLRLVVMQRHDAQVSGWGSDSGLLDRLGWEHGAGAQKCAQDLRSLGIG